MNADPGTAFRIGSTTLVVTLEISYLRKYGSRLISLF
jgi:hypothetical protein